MRARRTAASWWSAWTAAPSSTLVSTPGSVPASLVVNSANVYWAGTDLVLWQVSKVGGAPLQLASGVGPQTTVQGATVYFSPIDDGGVQAVPVGGGAIVTLTTQGAQANLVVAGGNVYWADLSGHIDYVSATDGGTPLVLVRPDDGGPMEYVGDTIYQNITTDGTNLYWPNGGGGASPGAVFAVALAGGHPLLLDAIGSDTPRSVATDGVYVYFLDVAGATSLVATPVNGGAPHTVTTQSTGSADVSGTPGPTVAVDSTSVYWLDPPRIVKLAK